VNFSDVNDSISESLGARIPGFLSSHEFVRRVITAAVLGKSLDYLHKLSNLPEFRGSLILSIRMTTPLNQTLLNVDVERSFLVQSD
jgi:hypothetical protein